MMDVTTALDLVHSIIPDLMTAFGICFGLMVGIFVLRQVNVMRAMLASVASDKPKHFLEEEEKPKRYVELSDDGELMEVIDADQ